MSTQSIDLSKLCDRVRLAARSPHSLFALYRAIHKCPITTPQKPNFPSFCIGKSFSSSSSIDDEKLSKFFTQNRIFLEANCQMIKISAKISREKKNGKDFFFTVSRIDFPQVSRTIFAATGTNILSCISRRSVVYRLSFDEYILIHNTNNTSCWAYVYKYT